MFVFARERPVVSSSVLSGVRSSCPTALLAFESASDRPYCSGLRWFALRGVFGPKNDRNV